MGFKTNSSKIGLTSLVVVGLILSLGWATSASATARQAYSLSGNTRTQIGNGLPLPITTVAAPAGKVQLSGVINQGTGVDPKPVYNMQSTLTFGPQTAILGLFLANSNVFQIQTSLIVTAPIADFTFKAGGGGVPSRTQFTWCPGLGLPNATFNPACTNPLAGGAIAVQASVRYQKTVAQFGGQNIPGVGGRVNLALKVPGNAGAPCAMGVTATCIAAFSDFAPAPSGQMGQPIGGSYVNLSPVPAKIHAINATPGGVITAVGPYVGPFPPNTVRSYGGPFTTGKVTLKAPGVNETFYLQGGDNRVNGIGTLSLVAGGVSDRGLSGVNSNRGWINYNIGGIVPSVSNTGLVLIALLFAAVSTWMLRRAIVQQS